jgi:hypothetical protein
MFTNKSFRKLLIIASLMLPLTAQAIVTEQEPIIVLGGDLTAVNQNGSDPGLINDPDGIVPTDASGSIVILLDAETNTLDFSLTVDGIFQSDLRNFGPNETPIHLHLAGGGNSGNFGPIAVDLSLGADSSNFTDTATGFEFSRSGVSILLEDQGGVQLGMHPGDDLIVDSLLSGDAFVLVHTNNSDINGFPFGEIRGNINPINPVPLPAALPMMILGLSSFGIFVRRKHS